MFDQRKSHILFSQHVAAAEKIKGFCKHIRLLITINLIRKIFVIFEGSNDFSLHQASHLSIHRASDQSNF